MRTYSVYIWTTWKLVMRDRAVLFFNYLLPLLFFIVFAQTYRADKGGDISQVISMVLIMGVLGSGFFGAGLRAVQEREQNILRRFKVAPITPMPILVSSLVTGLAAYLPSVAMVLGIAHFYYGMPWPERLPSLLLFLSLALLAFRSIGGMVASVVNSMQESQIIIQMLYLPMLFLSGATFPVSILPTWLQVAAQFLPATYLYTGLTGILVQKENFAANSTPALALMIMLVLATFLSSKMFRWEKEERVAPSAKFWLAAVLAPFLVLGIYQAYSKENVSKSKIVYREMRRNRALLIRGPRILLGDGRVVEAGGVLMKNGKIAAVFGTTPSADVKADVLEAAGKTLMPGLSDMHVHLMSPGGTVESWEKYKPEEAVSRELAAYLYCGITSVKSVGDPQATLLKAKTGIDRGDHLGAELFYSGKMFTTPGGHGTEYLSKIPEQFRALAEQEMLYLPKSPDEAKSQVRAQKQAGAAGVKVILESGMAGMLFNRLDTSILKAIGEEAQAQGLPMAVHTGDARDVADALAAGAKIIEHGSAREAIPDKVFADMARLGVVYDPTLTVIDALRQLANGSSELLDRTLVQQTAPEGLIAATKKFLRSSGDNAKGKASTFSIEIAFDNLRRAWKAGVPLITGSDAGNFLVTHGPTVHREMQLWVKAGIPPGVALAAALQGSAKALGISSRTGLIRVGNEATMVLIDGNPLEDIAITERISAVFYKGERVDRAGLFEKD